MTPPRWLDADTKRMVRCPDAALDAFLLEHVCCRPGLDVPHVTEMVVALWCESGAREARTAGVLARKLP